MRARYLSQEEIDRLSAVSTPEIWLPLRVAASTGLRVGDVVSLQRWQLRGDGVVYRAQKTGKWGFAPLSHTLARTLQRRCSGVWVFPKKLGRGHLTRQAVWSRVKKACERAGVDPRGVSPHSFRKFFAVDLLARTNLETVKNALQHSNVYVTELYAFSDWSTGDNALLSVKRCDIPIIIGQILPILEEHIDKKLKILYNKVEAISKNRKE